MIAGVGTFGWDENSRLVDGVFVVDVALGTMDEGEGC